MLDPSEGGVEVPSTLNPGKTAYLRYYVIENPQNELDEQFIESLYGLDTIGTLTEADKNIQQYLDIRLQKFCVLWNYLSQSTERCNSLFILSGTNKHDAQLHSVITFYCEKVGNKPTLIIDAFCSNQLLKKKVDNHGGRILFEAINQACKKMKIKQIDLEAVDEAIPWYLSKGFVHNFNKKDEGLTQMKKRVSWSSRSPWSSSPMKPVKKNVKVVKNPRKKPARKTSKVVKEPRSRAAKKTSKTSPVSPKKPVKKTSKKSHSSSSNRRFWDNFYAS
jgi:hypothetical protein